jgi:hypothetical protein
MLAGAPGFTLLWVWYISVAAVFLQLAMNLLLLRREFRVRLAFSSGAANAALDPRPVISAEA